MTEKPGRPPNGEQRDEMAKITFRVDGDTLAALEELERSEPAVRGRRSALLRRLIQRARANQK